MRNNGQAFQLGSQEKSVAVGADRGLFLSRIVFATDAVVSEFEAITQTPS